MQINLSEPYIGSTIITTDCVEETGNIIMKCNQYAGTVLIDGIIIGILIGAACMFAALWWYRGRKN